MGHNFFCKFNLIIKIVLFTTALLDYCQVTIYNSFYFLNNEIFLKRYQMKNTQLNTVRYLEYFICLTLTELAILHDQNYILVNTNKNTRIYFTRIK